MEIYRTFDKQYQGIYLARFVDCDVYETPPEYETELSKSLETIQDPLYVRQIIKSTHSGWKKGIYKNIPVNNLVQDVLDELEDLMNIVDDIMVSAQKNGLDWLLDNFIPLSDGDLLHKPERLKMYTYEHGSLLRIYGIQLGDNAVIITGIAIKLVRKMQDSNLLKLELDKMKHLRNWLINNNITHCEQL